MKKTNDQTASQGLIIQNINLCPHPSTPKRGGLENFQNFQHFLKSSKWQISKESLDTECTSNPPDPSDKHSLKSIDEVIEFREGEQPPPISPMIDFQPLALPSPTQEPPKNVWKSAEDTLKVHFRQTMKIDKYLRLISSIIKTCRAYNSHSRLNGLYKELILARRVIRWESKYDTLIELQQQELGIGMKMFKIMQLSGDLVDLVGFWLKIVHKGTEGRAALIQRLQQTESNFYFAECIIWFFVYIYRFIVLWRKKSESGANMNKQAGEQQKKMTENVLKAIKYCMDILTSYNNSSLKRVGGEINHKLAGYLTFLSSAIGIFLLWR